MISAWGTYQTATGHDKWVCADNGARTVRGHPSWPTVAIVGANTNRVHPGETIEVTVSRTGSSTSSLRVRLRSNQSTNGSPRTFSKHFGVGERRITFTVRAHAEGELIVELLHPQVNASEYHLGSVATVAVIVTPANIAPVGALVIANTTNPNTTDPLAVNVGDTLGVDTEVITDGNNADHDNDGTAGDIPSARRSYSWWKVVDFGLNAHIEERIAGARSRTYTVSRDDARARIRARVSYRDDDGYDEQVSSVLTAGIGAQTGAAPYVLRLEWRVQTSEGAIPIDPGSTFTASEGDTLELIFHMNAGVEGFSHASRRPKADILIGSREVRLHWHDTGDRKVIRLFYHVQAGDGGRVVLPRNAVLTIDRFGNETDPGNPVFAYPQRSLGTMAVPRSSRQGRGSGTSPTKVTASFHDLPSEHDGASRFVFRLTTSEVLRPYSRRSLIDALTIGGGTLRKVRKVETRQHWDVTVEPTSFDAVTIDYDPRTDCADLFAPCTSDDRAAANVIAATVPGPTVLSIGDASANESSVTPMRFEVTLNRPAPGPISVRWTTADETATAGADYTAGAASLYFLPGDRRKAIEVGLLDDSIDDDGETFVVNLFNANGGSIADGQGRGTIHNSGAMPAAWMARFGRTAGARAVGALEARFARSGDDHLTLAGIDVLATGDSAHRETPGAVHHGLDDPYRVALVKESSRADDLLGRSTFHLSGTSPSAGGARLSAWGELGAGGFDGDDGRVNVHGEIRSALLGADAEWDDVLAGVMLMRSVGEGGYHAIGPGSGTGSVDATLTSVHPYARARFGAGTAAWVMAGAGSGTLTVHQEGVDPVETGLRLRVGALGIEGRVLDGGADGPSLDVRSDALWVRTETDDHPNMNAAEAATSRLRLVLAGERSFALAGGGRLTPIGEIGLRLDGGDAETGTGVEAGAGVRYVRGRMSVEAKARTLLAHDDSGFEEWGAGGTIRVRPDTSGRGLALTLAPEWGRAERGSEPLGSVRNAREREGDQAIDGGARLVAEMGYGFRLPAARGMLTPYVGGVLGNAGHRTMRTGARWQLGDTLSASVEATRQSGRGASETNEVRLRAVLRF